MGTKQPRPSPIVATLDRLVKETCASFRAASGEELPPAIARGMVLRQWTEQWPHYIATQLANQLGLDQIAELNGSTQGAAAAAAAEVEDDEAE